MKLPRSDHFNGKTFFYPGAPAQRGLFDVLRWKLTSKAAKWPESPPPAIFEPKPLPLPPVPPAPRVSITWIGHSTFLIRSTAAGNFLTDPVFSDHIGPTPRLGTKRFARAAFPIGALPPLTGILLSHDHYDHCDLPSLRALVKRHAAPIYTPLGYTHLFSRAHLPAPIVLDWWESAGTVQLVPARHWTRRSLGGTNIRLWGGFMLQLPGKLIYFAGDTAFDAALFRDLRERCGRPTVALLPIGAYEPRWFMADAHMNPAEAVAAHQELGAARSIAMHWGAFQLTDEGLMDPPESLAAEATGAGLTPDEFIVPRIGQTVTA